MSDTADLDLANKVAQSISTHFPDIADQVNPLFSAAAFNLGGARVAHGLVAWKAQDGGYLEIQQKLADEQFDVLEIAALDACLRSVMTTLDLCAAALYRIGGATPKPGWEQSVAGWTSPPNLRPDLKAWVDALRPSNDRKELRKRRNEATHRTRNGATTFIGGAKDGVVEVEYDGSYQAAQPLTGSLARYGRDQFKDLCSRVTTAYPSD